MEKNHIHQVVAHKCRINVVYGNQIKLIVSINFESGISFGYDRKRSIIRRREIGLDRIQFNVDKSTICQ